MKEAAKAAKKAEEEAAGGVQLLRVAPRGTQYGGDSPEFPPGMRNAHLSRSMDALNEAPRFSHAAVVHPMMIPAPTSGKKNKKEKKRGLRRVQSLAEDGMLAQSPQERYHPAAVDGPVYYANEAARPVYVIDERNGDVHHHPNSRPRYLVPALPPQNRSFDHSGYVGSPAGTPVVYHYQQPHYLSSAPTTPPGGLSIAGTPPYIADGKTTVTRSAAGRHRNYVQIISRPENSKPAAHHKRPVSQFYTSAASMRPISTPLRTPSPMRSPSPAIFNTGPRKGKGKEIRVVEGWEEPDEEAPQVVQSHEVGVAPKSKVMDNFKSRSAAAGRSAPFSITINEDNPSLHLRDPSRRNKARPVSSAPWISSDSDFNTNGGSITRQNGHMVVDFNE